MGSWADRLRTALGIRAAESIPEPECGMRAAVTLILRMPPEEGEELELLFVRRAKVEGDPWSGHVALPGGRMDPKDADLLDTARRETLEETGLSLEREDHLGRLHELLPASRRLPSICVTPFVAMLTGSQDVRVNHELTGHLWVPVSVLTDPAHRSTLVRPSGREFPTIEYQGDVIWGMTFAIVEDFLDVCAVAAQGTP